MKPAKQKRWLIVVVCYGGALLLYLAGCGAQLLLDLYHQDSGHLQERALLFEQFYVEGVILQENNTGGTDLISIDSDPKMTYSPGMPFNVSLFTFEVEQISRPGGEMQLYYTTQQEEAFGPEKRLVAQQASDGSYYFDLDGREVWAVRFDLDTTGGILYRNWGITLGGAKPASDYFIPNTTEVFWLLFLPLLLSCSVLEVLDLKKDFVLRRKAKEKKERKK